MVEMNFTLLTCASRGNLSNHTQISVIQWNVQKKNLKTVLIILKKFHEERKGGNDPGVSKMFFPQNEAL